MVRFLLKYAAYEDDDSLALLAKYGYARGKILEEMMAVLKKHHINLSRLLENMNKGQKVLSLDTLALSGKDIKEALNLSDSPEIGEIKHMLLLHVIEYPQDNEKERLMAYLIKYISKLRKLSRKPLIKICIKFFKRKACGFFYALFGYSLGIHRLFAERKRNIRICAQFIKKLNQRFIVSRYALVRYTTIALEKP